MMDMMWTTLILASPGGGGGGGGHEAAAQAAAHPSSAEWFLFLVVDVGMAAIVLGIVLSLYRMLRGPHLADRVLSGDTFALHVVGLVILLAIRLRTVVFFDAALVVAIIGFASTLAFAQYIGTRGRAKTS